MRKVYSVSRIVPQVGVVCKDSVGREKVLHTDRQLVIGDRVLVVNDIVVGKVERVEPQVFNV